VLRGRYVTPPPANGSLPNAGNLFTRIIKEAKAMIDVGNKELVPMRLVPDLLPLRAKGKQVHVTLVNPQINEGMGGLEIESLTVGDTTCTSTETLQRFADCFSRARAGRVMPDSFRLQRRRGDRPRRLRPIPRKVRRPECSPVRHGVRSRWGVRDGLAREGGQSDPQAERCAT
jgi:hypothetical protein